MVVLGKVLVVRIAPRHVPGKPSLAKTKSVHPSYSIKHCRFLRHTAGIVYKLQGDAYTCVVRLWSTLCLETSTVTYVIHVG